MTHAELVELKAYYRIRASKDDPDKPDSKERQQATIDELVRQHKAAKS